MDETNDCILVLSQMLNQNLQSDPYQDNSAQNFHFRPNFSSDIFPDTNAQHGEKKGHAAYDHSPSEDFLGFCQGIGKDHHQGIDAGGDGKGHDVPEGVNIRLLLANSPRDPFVNHFTTKVGQQGKGDPMVDLFHIAFNTGPHEPSN